jgi:hypothetical protein
MTFLQGLSCQAGQPKFFLHWCFISSHPLALHLRQYPSEETEMPTITMEKKAAPGQEVKGAVYCPICTHTVDAMITYTPRSARVTPGQKCARCSSSLDAGYVLRVDRAA